ncbi:MAG: type VI secretion system tip protein VgrG, partial [Acidovorax sp.]|jgi:type VI secretion system secreted protein VgrG|nr:type VI secretion system tip protein VgrG [Acidovorax sp.]
MSIKSQTHKGNGFNELRFEDEAGQEEIYVHAQKDQNIHVNHDETTFVGHDRSEQVENDETITIGHDRKKTVGNDEQVSIGQDRRHDIGQDDFLSIGRSQHIRTAKDRIEEVGNHRHDKTAANHVVVIGGHQEQEVQGHAHLQAGQEIRQQTRVFRVQAQEAIVLEGPGGTLRIDGSGITLNGVAVQIKGPVSVQSGGSGNAHAIASSPAAGLGLDSPCGMRADGSCTRMPCPCKQGGR